MSLIALLMLSSFIITEAAALNGDTLTINEPFPRDSINITLYKNYYATPDRIKEIETTVMSEDRFTWHDEDLHKGYGMSTYYVGWNGAINSVTDMEVNFDVQKGYSDVLIMLLDSSHPKHKDWAAYTVSASGHGGERYIIYVYDIESVSNQALGGYITHELGHVFGLGHSTAPEDLMYRQLVPFAYVSSGCTTQGLEALYLDNKRNTHVVCEK
jgi:hypothetical protein